MSKLTKREEEVADLISQGYNQKEISKMLDIAYDTTRNHLTNIYSKLNLDGGNRKTSLAIWWWKNVKRNK